MKNFFSKEPTKPVQERPKLNLDKRLVNAVNPEQKATDPADFQQISIALPSYVIKQIKIRATENNTTMRYEVLRCLRDGGFDIVEADLVPDARRSKR